jgi:hypothetical protein
MTAAICAAPSGDVNAARARSRRGAWGRPRAGTVQAALPGAKPIQTTGVCAGRSCDILTGGSLVPAVL